MSNRVFQQNDRVGYHGEKFKGTLNGKEGFIVARIEGERDGYVVKFHELKPDDQDYVLPASVLGDYRPSKNAPVQEKNEVKVEQRRKPKRNAKSEDSE